MGKIVANLIFLLFLFFTAMPTMASSDICSEGMIDSIIFDLGTAGTAEIKEDGQTPDPIYKDSSNYYLDKEGNEIIKDVGNVTIKHSEAFLNKIADKSGTNINLVGPGACENEDKAISTIKNNNGSWSFTYTAVTDDAECIFGNVITLELRESKSGSNVICSRTYAFNTEPRDGKGNCNISIDPSGGATIENIVKIEASGIDDEGVGIRTFLNGVDNSPTFLKTSDKTGEEDMATTIKLKGDPDTTFILSKGTDGLLDFTYPLGKLSLGDYLFEIKYEDGDKAGQTICSINIPVVAYGETPTPAQQTTPGSTSINVEFAEPVGLCESIPASADCNGSSCLSKCTDCENSGGIWTGIGCMPTNFGGIVTSIFKLFSGLIGGLMFICIVINGFKIMASGGNPETMKKAREALTSCIVGFLVLAFSILFLKIVGVDILNLPGWSG